MTDLWNFFQELINTHVQQPEWLFLIIVLSTFILEDPTTLAVGYLLSQSQVSWAFALSSLVVGIFLGDFGLYLLGAGVRRGFFKTRQWKNRPTAFDLIVARFIPGLRTITFSAAGFFGVSALTFLMVGFISALVWSGVLLWGSSWIIAQFSFLPFWAWLIIGVSLMTLSHLLKSRAGGKHAKSEGSS